MCSAGTILQCSTVPGCRSARNTPVTDRRFGGVPQGPAAVFFCQAQKSSGTRGSPHGCRVPCLQASSPPACPPCLAVAAEQAAPAGGRGCCWRLGGEASLCAGPGVPRLAPRPACCSRWRLRAPRAGASPRPSQSNSPSGSSALTRPWRTQIPTSPRYDRNRLLCCIGRLLSAARWRSHSSIVHTPQITAETRQLWNQGVAERVSIRARLERL